MLELQGFFERKRTPEIYGSLDSPQGLLGSAAQIFCTFYRAIQHLVLWNDLVDGAERERFCGREWLAFENGGQRSLDAYETWQPLGAATTRCQCEEDFGKPDLEIAIRHDAHVTSPGKLRTHGKR
ncbi:hypothetical protein D3C72_2098940 [compost metagenome]